MVLAAVGLAAPSAEPTQAAGAIAGNVHLDPGAGLEPVIVANTTDPEVCGARHSLEDLVLDAKGGVANVILSLEGAGVAVVQGGAAPAPQRARLDNRDCRFEPHALVLTSGSTLEVANSDPTLHTVHWYGPTSGNLALPKVGGTARRPTIELRDSGMYQLRCDIHGWMRAYVRVDPHPYHAVTNAAGGYRIEGVPPGRYTLVAWHERLGARRRLVEVAAGSDNRVDLRYAATNDQEP